MNAHLLMFLVGMLLFGAMGSLFFLMLGAITLVALLGASAGF